MAVTLPDVTADEVIAQFEGDPDDLPSSTYLKAKADYAVDRLTAQFGTRIRARLDSGVLPERLFKATVAEAVLRIARNPDGYRMEQQGNYQYQLNTAVSAGYLWFTKDNMLDLVGASFPPIGTATIGDHRRQ